MCAGSLFQRRVVAVYRGRSSGFPALSDAFPLRFIETVAYETERVPFETEYKDRGYSGGTTPEFHGIPY